jgi:hypothetical protein
MLACTLSCLVVLGTAAPAQAHEGTKLGAYQIEIGWAEEPAFTGQRNAVQIVLHDAAEKPVRDLGDSLQVEVVFGRDKMPKMTFEPAFGEEFGEPGDYRAWFFPTRPGKYTFHLIGSIKGQNVDQSFTSSPTGFDEVEEPTDKQFPAKDPSTAQLGQRLDRLEPRIAASVASERSRARSVENRNMVIGIAGVVAALIALIAAMTRRRA